MTRAMSQRETPGKGSLERKNVVRNAAQDADAEAEAVADAASARFRTDFGETLRSARQRLKLTQDALAQRSDLSVDAVRRIEAGRFSPSLDTLRKLSVGLQLSLPTLFQAMDGERPAPVSELSDYLSQRSPRELKLAWKVLRAMFDDR